MHVVAPSFWCRLLGKPWAKVRVLLRWAGAVVGIVVFGVWSNCFGTQRRRKRLGYAANRGSDSPLALSRDSFTGRPHVFLNAIFGCSARLR